MYPEYYDVRRIQSGVAVFQGYSISAAATALVEGACYGTGRNPAEAATHAKKEVRKFRGQKFA